MEAEFEILEERGVHAVLFQLKETPGILRSELYRKMEMKGVGDVTIIKRVNKLISAGLIRWEQSSTHKKGQYLFLTKSGEDVVEHLGRIKHIMEVKENDQ